MLCSSKGRIIKNQVQIQKTPRDNVIFRCISLNYTRTACAMEYILYYHAFVPRVAMNYKIYSIARGESKNFKITKMAE